METKVLGRSTERLNLATKAEVDLSKPVAVGSFKLCYRGTYTKGERTGKIAMCKIFKTGSVFASSFFDAEIEVVDIAHKAVRAFNHAGILSFQLRLNRPEIWEVESGSRKGEKILVEPYIENFRKFNSNSGWRDSSGKDNSWVEVMQALSHFSYHNSGGKHVLCDVQGGLYADGAILTDPVVLSNKAESLGPTDLGRHGIITFFAKHKCGKYCKATWNRPKLQAVYYPDREGTSMSIDPTPPVGAEFMSGNACGGGGRMPSVPSLPDVPSDFHKDIF